jgi:hypothetical protein
MGIKGRMKTNSATFTVCVAVNLSMALWAAITVLSVNNAYASHVPDTFLKIPSLPAASEKGIDIASIDPVPPIAGDTSTHNEHTEFARERISEIADRLSDDVEDRSDDDDDGDGDDSNNNDD